MGIRKTVLPIIISTLIFATLGLSSDAFAQTPSNPPPNFKVAFIGDQGSNTNSEAVLQLIANENTDMVLHQGDFDYGDDPDLWDSQITAFLGPAFPYFASVGNHDVLRWSDYQIKLQERLDLIPNAICTGDLGVQSSCNYQGLFFILSGVGTLGSGHDTYIRDQLESDDSVWSICSWHKNQNAMQVGKKSNSTGWEVYEECRHGGAIIATAHEHSYERTKTLSSTENQIVDAAWSDPTEMRVAVDSTFVFVSGLGGQNIRDQERCIPTEYPYGCKGEWASIYTSNQGAKPGALFCSFNVGGEVNKASCYFKNTDGLVVDSFNVTSFMGSPDIPNSTPVANNNSSTTDEDNSVAITLTATDDDVGDVLSYFVVSGPTNGALSGTAPNLTYTPDTDYNGMDSFEFKANDGRIDSNVAVISITVNPINDAPSANAGVDQTLIDGDGNNIESVDLIGSGSDIDGIIASYEWTEGSTSLGTSVLLTTDFTVGVHTIVLEVTDNDGAKSSDTVIITINPKLLANLTITNPPPGEISGKITISAIVEGFESTVTVIFEIFKIVGTEQQSVFIDSDSTAPYSTSIHTKTLEKGASYSITASASDVSGNSDFDSVEVNVPTKGGGGGNDPGGSCNPGQHKKGLC